LKSEPVDNLGLKSKSFEALNTQIENLLTASPEQAVNMSDFDLLLASGTNDDLSEDEILANLKKCNML
jgi:hypothetical protein